MMRYPGLHDRYPTASAHGCPDLARSVRRGSTAMNRLYYGDNLDVLRSGQIPGESGCR
jgi:hypothetical protein